MVVSYLDPDADYNERGTPRKDPSYCDHHRFILRALRKSAMSDQGIYDRIVKFKGKVMSPSGCRTRRQELEEFFGFVQRVGTGRTEAGRSCAMWGLTVAGRVKADEEFEAAKQFTLDTERAA